MNVYMIINELTGKTGTCLNIAEFCKVMKVTKHRLLAGGTGYKAVYMGGAELRKQYQTIDDVFAWISKNSNRCFKGWRHKEFYLTAYDLRKEQRDNEEAMLLMIEQSDQKYGNIPSIDRIINQTKQQYEERYFKAL